MPTLQEFLTAAKPQNPGVDDVALTDYYNKTYGGQPTPAPQLVATSSPTLQEFLTAAKPQNPGVDDDALTDYYNKTYAKSAVPTPPPQEPNKEILGGIPRQVADVPLKVGAGVVTGVRMIADAFGADNAASKNLRGVENWVADLYSAQSKKDSQEVARIMKDAQDKGVLDNVIAGIKAFSVAPVDLLANALGTSAPAIVATLGTILTGGAPLVAGAVGVGTGAVMGAGVVKGSIYDATKQILGERTKMSPEQIEKTAIEAQNYEGKNLDQILLGALITGIGSVTGAETALARQLAKGIATTVAQKEAVKLATKEATEKAAKRGVIKNAAYTAGKEFLGEGAEGGQERMAQNIAQQRLGFDVPTMRGVVGQGTLEGMAGLGMGAASGGREAAGAKRELAVQDLIKSGTGTDALKEAFTPPGRAKAAQQTRTDEELEKEFNATPPSAANSLEELAAKYLTAYPEGKEGDISTDRKAELNVTKLNGLLKNLGIEIPKAEKGKTRINAMAALRDYMGKKNAGITEEELTDIPDLTGTPNGTQTTETVKTETKGQQASTATDVTPSVDENQAAIDAAIARINGSPAPSTSRIVGTTKVNVGGKESTKVNRLDGSVEIDGVQVVPPTSQTQTATKKLDQQQVATMTDEQLKLRMGDFLIDDDEHDLVEAEVAKRRDAFYAAKQAKTTAPKQMADIDKGTYDILKEDYAANPTDTDTLAALHDMEQEHNLPLTGVKVGEALPAKERSKAVPFYVTGIEPEPTVRWSVRKREVGGGHPPILVPFRVEHFPHEQVSVTGVPLSTKEEAEADTKEYNAALNRYGADPNDLQALGTINDLLGKHGIQTAQSSAGPVTLRSAENLHYVYNNKLTKAVNEKKITAREKFLKARQEKTLKESGEKEGSSAFKALSAKVSAIAREMYDKIRNEYNPTAKEKNKLRTELAKVYKAALAEYTQQAKKLSSIVDEIDGIRDPERVTKIEQDLKKAKADAIAAARGVINQSINDVKGRITKLENNLKTVEKEKKDLKTTEKEKKEEVARSITHAINRERVLLKKRETKLKDVEINVKGREINSLTNTLEKEKKKPIDAQRLARLKEEQNTAARVFADAEDSIIDAENALINNPFMHELPDWEDHLSLAEKNIYFGNITANNVGNEQAHRNAAAALLQSYEKGKDRNLSREDYLTKVNYNENRKVNSRVFGVHFPPWDMLSDTARKAYTTALKAAGSTQSTIEQDQALFALGKVLIKEQEKVSLTPEEVAREQIRLENKAKIEQQSRENRERDRAALEDQERSARYDRIYTTEGNLFDLVKEASNTGGSVNEILNFLKVKKFSGPIYDIHKGIFKAITDALLSIDLNTKIVLVEDGALKANEKAIYDPTTDTIYISRKYATDHTVILHEVIHAATVKVISQYITDKTKLTASQQKAVQQLYRLMQLTRERGSQAVPEAYENIYEFVSYALTDYEFQEALSRIEIGSADIFNEPNATAREIAAAVDVYIPTKIKSVKTKQDIYKNSIVGSALSKFKTAIAKVLGIIEEIEDLEVGEDGNTIKDFVEGDEQNVKSKVVRHRVTNAMMEIAAAFEDILLAQKIEPGEKGVSVKTLSAKQKAPLKAEPREGGFDDPEIRKAYELTEKETGKSKEKGFFKQLFSTAGWRNIARLTTDKTYEARSHYIRQDLGDKIIRDKTKAFNNFTELMDTSTSIIQNYITHNLSQHLEELKKSMQDYAALVRNGDMDAAQIDIHMLGEMFGEPERREAFFVTTVSLSKEDTGPKAVTFFGKQMGAASVRTAILGDPSKGTEGIIHKYVLTDTQKQNLWNILKGLANTHADYSGYSPRNLTFSAENKKAGIGLKKDDPTYNVLGISTDEVNLRKKQYAAYSQTRKDAIQRIFTSVKALTDATKELNQMGNFWSAPVTNLTGMYNYQYYMPYKGLSKLKETSDPHVTERNIDLSRMTEGKSNALLDQEYATGGRFSVSDNPILQVMFDSFRAAHRAGIVKATEALKNSAKYDKVKNPNGTGIINAEIVENIPLAGREISNIEKYKGSPNVVFHYNEDGSIDVIRIHEPKLAEAIRYTFKRNNVALDAANNITAFFGSMHTRYNWNFAPKNFVVDMLTNAWNIGGGKFGPANALVYIGDVGATVMRNGLGKAMQVAYLHDKGDPASRKQLLDMASKDPFVRDMVEMLRFGGKSVYIDSMALRANYEKLSKIGRNKILAKLDQFNAMVDTWNNMFEFTSRTAAYTLFKEKMYAANVEAGMSDVKGKNNEMSPAEEAAAWQAAAETKNLANFEKVGAIGRELGAAYMFFRPSAMGAARAIETVAPAFMFTDNMIKNSMPGNIQDDPVASALYIENYKKLRTNAQIMASALMGMGYLTYLMSMMMAPDDEWKRNSVRSDDMQQWTKFARFHLPDDVSKQIFGRDSKNIVLQMPWGYGLGAFAAIGAQIGGMVHGQASWQKGFGNIGMSILSDSFLPIPISRIPPTESPGKWLIDSITPSVLRPMFEYLMNTNGIGQAINSANTRKYGEAFTGGDKIPDAYKDTARYVYSSTQGAWDMSPNTMYFLANSYMDGLSRLGETGYSWVNLTKGEKIFNPKTDLALIGSFFGSKSNVDSREFTSIGTKLKDLDQRIKTLSDKDPVAYAKFIANNPMADAAVGLYNSELVNINRIRAEANEIRTSPFSPKLKEQLLRINILQQNMAKHQFILTVKAYGIEP